MTRRPATHNECRPAGNTCPRCKASNTFAGLQMRDAGLKTSFGEGLGRFSTLVWVTHSWTKAEFCLIPSPSAVNLARECAEPRRRRAVISGRAAAELTLPQAALLAAFIGDRTSDFDPWCGPAGAVAMRSRILQRMRDNRVHR